ncbi:hypothetical protein [Streptomyces sp. NPDC056387]|uniref:hypothetical protein n=1 Tax=Streptomyces sp. NPDC056387 TaxID=3345803 RepID=UPI0035E3B102
MAALRRIAAWRPAVVVAGVVLTGVSLDLLPVAGLLLLLALAPLGRRAGDRDRRPRTVTAVPGS